MDIALRRDDIGVLVIFEAVGLERDVLRGDGLSGRRDVDAALRRLRDGPVRARQPRSASSSASSQ